MYWQRRYTIHAPTISFLSTSARWFCSLYSRSSRRASCCVHCRHAGQYPMMALDGCPTPALPSSGWPPLALRHPKLWYGPVVQSCCRLAHCAASSNPGPPLRDSFHLHFLPSQPYPRPLPSTLIHFALLAQLSASCLRIASDFKSPTLIPTSHTPDPQSCRKSTPCPTTK